MRDQPTIDQTLRDEAEVLTRNIGEVLAETIGSLDDRTSLPPGADTALKSLEESLPETGNGLEPTLERLLELNRQAGANTGGPRCFHFVIGGSTPAALAADLLATACETLTYTWVTSPIGVTMELRALAWLRELFGLPADWSGAMVTGGTMANFVGLAAGRQWWGEQHGFDVSEDGLAGKPRMPVLTSGFVHAATRKCLALQGIGRGNLQTFTADATGRIDLDGFEQGLRQLDGAPALVVVNAGEVNAGAFDPVEEMISIARQHKVWVHVDGAFGLFARVSPRTEHLVRGVEYADSVAVDGHKWLNVPYDSGYAFVRDHGLMARAFRYTADYLPPEDDPRPTLGAIAPESSRRGRSFAVWATLAAYGREGQRRLVEHCLDNARHLADRVTAAEDLELLAEVGLNIVPFRFNPGGLSDEQLDDLNHRLGEAVLADGRFLVGTSKLGPRTIFRPAFSNWRTTTGHVDEFVTVIRELGAAVHAGGGSSAG
ncbi:pyridoxal phosphate-dependent decarboxylase family protein [Elongatibacter sediminis]|uniref:Aminotransferase class V-fold PLP-dependent enzyme n=1 Tax=Elongatibacter sediminis TaxID=3119006 RepID=A0AAW9R678_9GAMM